MKNQRKKLAVLAFVLFLGFMMMFPVTAGAGGFIEVGDGLKQTIVLSPSDKKEGYLLETYHVLPADAEKVKVVSSKKSVACVENQGGGVFYVFPKKTGTTDITVSAVSGKERLRWKVTVKVKKFKNPFKTFKINDRNCLKKIKGSDNYIHIKNSKVKLDYKLKSGWKIFWSGSKGLTKKTVKNHKTYTLKKKKDFGELSVWVENKKSGERITVLVDVER